jgi:hypothetical protein
MKLTILSAATGRKEAPRLAGVGGAVG